MTKATKTTHATMMIVAALAPALLLGCSNEKVPIGQQNRDGQTADGPVTNADAGQSATGGAVASGGAVGSGGRLGSGGAVSTGGRTGSGGAVGMDAAVTGGTASGGAPGTGGAGGSRLDAATDAPVALDAAADAGRTCGGLAGLPCASGELCDLPAGSCQMADLFGTCKARPQVCTDEYQPVCGCDGQTYRNDCTRLLARVTKQRDGECVVTTLPCPQLTTRADCDARGDCHSVFVDPNDCDCPLPGCCARFSRCATGGRAVCDAAVACATATPYCAGDYTISYAGNCFEGCVLKTACAGLDAGVAAPTCPAAPPTQGATCGAASLSCFYDQCPGSGRTQATCTGGTWSVQTAACGAFTCAGYPNTAFTCASGKVCVVTAGGAISAGCADNGCGAGAVSAACITGAAGCTMSTATGGVTFTCNTCPQGGCP